MIHKTLKTLKTMALDSHPFLTRKKATKLRKKLFKYTAINENGEPVSGYIKSDKISLALSKVTESNPGYNNINITTAKIKH